MSEQPTFDDLRAQVAALTRENAALREALKEAWWKGRGSHHTLPIAGATGPLLRWQCESDVAALARPADRPAREGE